MSKKITETIERWCCQPEDITNRRGEARYEYCIHCLQKFEWKRRLDAAGSREDYLVKVEEEGE
jgi:hypothetical protein